MLVRICWNVLCFSLFGEGGGYRKAFTVLLCARRVSAFWILLVWSLGSVGRWIRNTVCLGPLRKGLKSCFRRSIGKVRLWRSMNISIAVGFLTRVQLFSSGSRYRLFSWVIKYIGGWISSIYYWSKPLHFPKFWTSKSLPQYNTLLQTSWDWVYPKPWVPNPTGHDY